MKNKKRKMEDEDRDSNHNSTKAKKNKKIDDTVVEIKKRFEEAHKNFLSNTDSKTNFAFQFEFHQNDEPYIPRISINPGLFFCFFFWTSSTDFLNYLFS